MLKMWKQRWCKKRQVPDNYSKFQSSEMKLNMYFVAKCTNRSVTLIGINLVVMTWRGTELGFGGVTFKSGSGGFLG